MHPHKKPFHWDLSCNKNEAKTLYLQLRPTVEREPTAKQRGEEALSCPEGRGRPTRTAEEEPKVQ